MILVRNGSERAAVAVNLSIYRVEDLEDFDSWGEGK